MSVLSAYCGWKHVSLNVGPHSLKRLNLKDYNWARGQHWFKPSCRLEMIARKIHDQERGLRREKALQLKEIHFLEKPSDGGNRRCLFICQWPPGGHLTTAPGWFKPSGELLRASPHSQRPGASEVLPWLNHLTMFLPITLLARAWMSWMIVASWLGL